MKTNTLIIGIIFLCGTIVFQNNLPYNIIEHFTKRTLHVQDEHIKSKDSFINNSTILLNLLTCDFKIDNNQICKIRKPSQPTIKPFESPIDINHDSLKRNFTEMKCSNFRTGKFIYIGINDGIVILRDSCYQTESNGIKKIKMKIEWISDCKYKLTFVEPITKEDEILQNKTILVTIYETTNNTYKFYSEAEEKILYGELEKIE